MEIFVEKGMTECKELNENEMISIASGYNFNIGISESRKLFCWKNNMREFKEVLIPKETQGEPILCRMGYEHCLILTNRSELLTVVRLNDNKQLLDIKIEATLDRAYQIGLDFLVEKEKIVSVTCGCFHSLILTNQGRVYGWGNNSNGQLGEAINVENLTRPKLFEGELKDKVIVQITASYDASLFLSESGVAYGCGQSPSGIGIIANNYKQCVVKKCDVKELENKFIHAIVCRGYQAFFLVDDKKVILSFDKNGSNKIELKSPVISGMGGYNCHFFLLEDGSFNSKSMDIETKIEGKIIGINEKYPFYCQRWSQSNHKFMSLKIKKAVFTILILKKTTQLFKNVPKPVLFLIFQYFSSH